MSIKEKGLKLVSKRKPISQSLRFDVLEKDNFACQYCGAKATDDNVLLEIDHIVPVSQGGGNNIENLTTSCKKCNMGKGVKKLGAKKRLTLRQKEIRELEQKREQLEAYIKSRLNKTEEIKPLIDYINHIIKINTGFGFTVSDYAINKFLCLYKKLDKEEFVEVIENTDFPNIKSSQDISKKEEEARDNANWFIVNIELNLKKSIKKKKQGVVSLSGYLRGILKNRTTGWEDVWEISKDISNILRPISAREDKIKILEEKLIPMAKEIPQNEDYTSWTRVLNSHAEKYYV
jgi:hypothetical protein